MKQRSVPQPLSYAIAHYPPLSSSAHHSTP
jgi:hypothetical protein